MGCPSDRTRANFCGRDFNSSSGTCVGDDVGDVGDDVVLVGDDVGAGVGAWRIREPYENHKGTIRIIPLMNILDLRSSL